MMTGVVRSRHALLPVTFLLANMPDTTIEFVLDTGFTGLLTLPEAVIDALALPFEYPTFAQLADGSTVVVAVHLATILWNGDATQVRALATGERPLLGTGLLEGCEVLVQFRDEGLVEISIL
jgi:clan AA aspartic protease